MKDYCSLHNHTYYSLMDSIIRPEQLFKRAAELGQSSIAITDHSSLACAWEGLKYSKKHNVKLIMGCEFYFTENLADENSKLRHIILIAKNYEGYKNLLLANKLANDNYSMVFKKVIPRIDWNILEKCSNGLICTTACGGGILSKLINIRQTEQAKNEAKRLKDIFGTNLALEIQPHALRRNASDYNDYEDQTLVNHTLINFGKELDIKVIAATDAHYLLKEQWESHDVWLSIGTHMPVSAVSRLKYPVHEFYVKSRDEVENFFSRIYKEKAAEFCDNTLYFSDMCEKPDWIDPKWSNPSGKELPDFPVKDQNDYDEFKKWITNQSQEIKNIPEDASYYRYWCLKGLKEKIPEEKWGEYQKRLDDEEFQVLEYHNFSSYMNIVSDIVEYCKNNNIPTSPGRGSAAGALSAHLSGIHQTDSIKYDLLFARFHNKEKTSFPDIDLDIASADREKVKVYLRNKYGEDNVAHVSNVLTMTAKPYAKDIARAFKLGGSDSVKIGNDIADSIPSDISSITKALKKAPLFMEYASVPEYSVLAKYAKDLDGLPKAWSTHAGGIIIGKRPLVECVPLRRDKENNIALEYDKDKAEENGLVKIDLLCISTLDIIVNTIKLIQKTKKKFNPNDLIDYESTKTGAYDLISSGNTYGVFQLGSGGGAIDLCKKIKPKCIEDLAVINALIRPNAAAIRKHFIEARDSGKKVQLMHPSLERAFSPTHGFAIFEESLLHMAYDVAGWDLHTADRLRKFTKGKGKYSDEVVSKWRSEFIEGAVSQRGISREIATKIWDEIILSFSGYAFNKAHAISYSLLGFQTAYLKANYLIEFLTANLMREVGSNAITASDNILKIKNEIRKNNVKIIPPNINLSEQTYTIVDDNTLMTGLDAAKDMGKKAIPEIVKYRPYSSFDDLLSKVNARLVNAKSIKAMAASGTLDVFGLTRKQMYLYGGDYKKKLKIWLERRPGEEFKYPWPNDIGEWTISEKYAMELRYLGEGLCCNIIQAYPGFFNRQAVNFSTLAEKFPDTGDSFDRYELSSDNGVVQGVVRSYFEFKVKKETSKIFGQTMAKMDLEDPYGNIMSMTLFPSGLEKFNKRLKELGGRKFKFEPGIGVHCFCTLNWYEGNLSLIFNNLARLTSTPKEPEDLKDRRVKLTITSRKRNKTNKIDKQKFLKKIEEEQTEDGYFAG